MYEVALREAYNNSKNSPEFLEFKMQNESKYEADALYRVISKIHGDDNFALWGQVDDYSQDEIDKVAKATGMGNWSEVDKNLYTHKNYAQSKARIAELKTKYKDDYDYYIFQQMLLEKENAKVNKLSKETGINIIGDSPVAPTSVEVWTNQKLFMKQN